MTNNGPTPQSDHLAQITRHLAQVESLAAAWLYGSRARGDSTPDSDYDIALALNNFPRPYAERRLQPELIALDLSAILGHPVHVVDINLAPIPLAINILDDGQPLLVKDELRYCRELNRICGLWEDHSWHKERTRKENQR